MKATVRSPFFISGMLVNNSNRQAYSPRLTNRAGIVNHEIEITCDRLHSGNYSCFLIHELHDALAFQGWGSDLL